MTHNWRRGLFISLAVLVVVSIAAALGLWFHSSGVGNDPGDEPTGTVAFDPEVDNVLEEADCDDNTFLNNSLRRVLVGDDEYRQFATAVSTPFKAENGQDALTEFIDEQCGNPTLLAQSVGEMALWDDVPGAEENMEWITQIQTLIDDHGLDYFKSKVDGVVIVTPEYQKFVGWVNTVWLRFTVAEKAQAFPSIRNWEVSAVSQPMFQPIPYVANTPDDLPAWELILENKNGDCLAREALNDRDKRIEALKCEGDTPNPPSRGSDCVETNSCGGDIPECTDEHPCNPDVCPPEYPHGTPPNCKDDQGNSPYNNGNGSTGGGPSATDGPGDKTVLQPTTDTPRVDPTPPAPEPVPVPDPAPAPSPETSAPPVNNPSTGCSPPPGMTTC